MNWDNSGADCLVNGVATLDCIEKAVYPNIITALFAFLGLVVLIMFILGSIKLMNAAGDQKKIQSAKNSFTAAMIGGSIILFSYVIIYLVSYVTHTPCIIHFGFGVC
jgi:hypothetical protein